MPDDPAPARRRLTRARSRRISGIDPSQAVRIANEAFHGPAWHGPALKVTLQRCGHDEAQHRLAPGRNTVWELVLHAAYGKHVVRSRLTNDRRRFARPMRRAWWPRIVDPSAEGWQRDLELLDSCHEAMVGALAEATTAHLARRRPGKPHTFGDEAIGIALHDIYHAGQIALIRKLVQRP